MKKDGGSGKIEDMKCIICDNPLKGKQEKYCGNPCEKRAYKLRDRKRYLEGKKKYREKNKDKILAYSRQYKAQGIKSLGKKQRVMIILERGGICQRCGTKENLNIHHIIPLRKGGTHKKENLMVLCFPCHMEWEKRMKDFWK